MGKLSQLKLRKQAEAQQVAHFEEILKNTKTLHKNPAKMLELLYKGEVKCYTLQQDSGAQRIGMIFQEMTYHSNYSTPPKNEVVII